MIISSGRHKVRLGLELTRSRKPVEIRLHSTELVLIVKRALHEIFNHIGKTRPFICRGHCTLR